MCSRTIGLEAIIEGSVTQQMSEFSKTSEFTATDATIYYNAPKFNAPHSGGTSSSETALPMPLGCFTSFQYCTRRSLTFWQCNIIQCNVLHCSFNTSFMRNAMDFHSMHCTAWNCTRLLHIAFQSITFQPSALSCSPPPNPGGQKSTHSVASPATSSILNFHKCLCVSSL